MENFETQRRWGAAQRLEFIEFRLFWSGWINRADIVERFSVSVPQASNDLTQYRDLAPKNLKYDASAKRYLATEDFKPIILKPNPDRYLSQLKAMAEGIITIEDTWIVDAPVVDALPIPSRKMDPQILRTVVEAVRSKRSLAIKYHSMSDGRPQASWRDISPHAFVYDGLRWHTRAYCHETHVFKDFILSRCRETGAFQNGYDSSKDGAWHTFIDVVLKPNPALNKNQQDAVAWDYNMTDGKVTVPVRLAYLYYFNKRLRLDIPSDRPKERPVIVANEEVFLQALQSVST